MRANTLLRVFSIGVEQWSVLLLPFAGRLPQVEHEWHQCLDILKRNGA